MLTLETSIQQLVKVELEAFRINDLVSGLPELGRTLALRLGTQLLDRVQERLFEDVQARGAEIVCKRAGCGVVHIAGSGTLLHRGSRPRKLKTSSGILVFKLHQLTCRGCKGTWSPFADWLGLKPRQRVSEELERKLVEWVTELSYAKTCKVGGEWLGATLAPKTLHRYVQQRGSEVCFTPAAECSVALADGTKVPAGSGERGCEIRFSLQILGREEHHGRSRVLKRIAGWSVGAGPWSRAIPAGIATDAIVTDREQGLAELMEKEHPGVFHGMCEWHLGHTLDHLLLLDGVKNQERKQRVGELGRAVWGSASQRASRYHALCDTLKHCRNAHRFLQNVAGYVLAPKRPSERTTSVIEREMREINRRADVGVRWSIPGIDHLLRLRHSKRINPDDFDRVWSTVAKPAFQLVPLT
ncbi:MAG TPA: hypothetical protein VF771_21975 [Longimicrobiaceae bacterium]